MSKPDSNHTPAGQDPADDLIDATRPEACRFTRLSMEDHGVLEIQLHTDGMALVWNHEVHCELARVFGELSRDRSIRVVLLRGTGEWFTGPRATPNTSPPEETARSWDHLQAQGWDLLWNLLSIDAPVVACVNGPVWRHAEIPLLSDIVIAAPNASFQDSAHFRNDRTPGDGMALFMPVLMGLSRARKFLLTGQELSAQEALEMGIVHEVTKPDLLLSRGRSLARELASRNPLVLRHTRQLLVQPLKELAVRHLRFGLALEGIGVLDEDSHKETGQKATRCNAGM